MPANSPRFLNLGQMFFGKVIDHLPRHQTTYEARSELQPWLAALPGAAQIHL